MACPVVASITERTDAMEGRAKQGLPLVDSELAGVIASLENILPDSKMDSTALRILLEEIAHLSHKDWNTTEKNSMRLGNLLLKNGASDEKARHMLERILEEGRWDSAAKHAADRAPNNNPWAVLVTGVNGIRKTTSVCQPWFPELLAEALVAPPGKSADIEQADLPCASNSFFRQLDHMICTLCNEDFSQLYSLIGTAMKGSNSDTPSKLLLQKYSSLKAAIFSRYRTLSELLGAFLITEAQSLQSNCMMETSGKDVAMFHYVNHFFSSGYNKLALHFEINDLEYAEKSVDARMVREIQEGIAAVGDTRKVIYANAGGPYGSEVLAGVQQASDYVWQNDILPKNGIGQDWYKATIRINAHATQPWTAQAVRPDGSLGTEFTFQNR